MKITLIIIFSAAALNAQWIGGAGYQFKSSSPEKGLAVYVIKKLPFQFPDFGINIKGKANYFFTEETFNEYSADIFLETNIFTRFIQPYADIGLGGGYISSNTGEVFFSVSGSAGIKMFYDIQPFIGIQIRKIFINKINNVELESTQFIGKIGVLFNL